MFLVKIAAIAVLAMMGIPVILMWLKFFRDRKRGKQE